jgi:hypothetical protein
MDATGRWKRTEVQAHVGLRAWLGSALFRSYLRRFVLLWIAGKLANVLTAHLSGIPPYAFRPGTELVILGFELGVIVIFIKNANEDVLLGNLGLRLSAALAPLVPVHVMLSAALAVLAG